MIRTLIIYLAVLTGAGLLDSRLARAGSQESVVLEEMQPVKADGSNVSPPKIMDFTKNPEADQTVREGKHRTKKLVSKR